MTRWHDVNGIYQIYPRSFKDSNGDGIGDLPGIIEKLSYIKDGRHSLGIDGIWISPFFKSPMADFGYDISDYYTVDPLFGTNDDFKHLLKEAHRREIKVMIDYVPNHTSDQHEWFKESRSSRDNPRRDWYVWHDPKPDGSPPNNWLSVFGGSAWEYDEPTDQYYLHSFLAAQPDLNWDNPDVRKAMTDVLDFWLSMGVDGIRADAVRWLSKDTVLFDDNPPNPNYKEGDDPYHKQLQLRSRYGDLLDSYLYEIAATVAKYPDRIVLFEDYPDERINEDAQYVNFYSIYPKVAAPFNFDGMRTPYSAPAFRNFIDSFQDLLGKELRPFYCFSNHDQPRLASRVGHQQAKLIGMMQLTLPGIPVVYYGDELGMHSVEMPQEIVRDPFGLAQPRLGRDPERTPMQWTAGANAGFSVEKPWLPLANDSADNNTEVEFEDTSSFLAMYHSLLELRHEHDLHTGVYHPWEGSNDQVFGYTRKSGDHVFLMLFNMSDTAVECEEVKGAVIYSTHSSVQWSGEACVTLEPHQGLITRYHQD